MPSGNWDQSLSLILKSSGSHSELWNYGLRLKYLFQQIESVSCNTSVRLRIAIRLLQSKPITDALKNEGVTNIKDSKGSLLKSSERSRSILKALLTLENHHCKLHNRENLQIPTFSKVSINAKNQRFKAFLPL